MNKKFINNLLLICILTIISFLFVSCNTSGDSSSSDDYSVTFEIENNSYIHNIQVYTVNGWKYIEDGSTVTVDKYFKVKLMRVKEDSINYYYYSQVIATSEGTNFTITDDTIPKIERINRTEPFVAESPNKIPDYYLIKFDSTITDKGTVTYESLFMELSKPYRVDYAEDQEIENEKRSNSDYNYFGVYDFSDNTSPELSSDYYSLKIYIDGTSYTLKNNVILNKNDTTTIIEDDLK